MNFLDPNQWNDLVELEKEYEVLNDELVKNLHERLRPYFLRRSKAEVLKLPPKVCLAEIMIPWPPLILPLSQNEVIVPVSLTPLQKELYKSVLSTIRFNTFIPLIMLIKRQVRMSISSPA